jgi:hypothetical protein
MPPKATLITVITLKLVSDISITNTDLQAVIIEQL